MPKLVRTWANSERDSESQVFLHVKVGQALLWLSCASSCSNVQKPVEAGQGVDVLHFWIHICLHTRMCYGLWYSVSVGLKSSPFVQPASMATNPIHVCLLCVKSVPPYTVNWTPASEELLQDMEPQICSSRLWVEYDGKAWLHVCRNCINWLVLEWAKAAVPRAPDSFLRIHTNTPQCLICTKDVWRRQVKWHRADDMLLRHLDPQMVHRLYDCGNFSEWHCCRSCFLHLVHQWAKGEVQYSFTDSVLGLKGPSPSGKGRYRPY